MRLDLVWVGHFKGLAFMPYLPARGSFSFLPRPLRSFESISRGRSAAVSAVLVELSFQFCDTGFELGYSCFVVFDLCFLVFDLCLVVFDERENGFSPNSALVRD